MTSGISNPTVKLNGNVVAIVPNSLEAKRGDGEDIARPMSAGGGSVQIVYTKNIETLKGTAKFSLPNTSEGINAMLLAKENFFSNQLEISDPSFQMSFDELILMNDPVIPLSQDGEIELEFEGAPALPTT